jgi:WD40 repeat protein
MIRVILWMFFTAYLSANLSVDPSPKFIIEGEQAKFARPEGFRFSPSGDCLAVANAEGDTVTIYRRIGNRGCAYETAPACVLGGAGIMRYPHDVAFSSSGMFLAVACRETHSILFFKRKHREDVLFDPVPHAVIEGRDSKLQRPAGLSFSPDDQLLVVSNRDRSGSVNFYSLIDEEKFLFSKKPVYSLPGTHFLDYGLAAPHCVVFSPDGHFIAITHKRFRGRDSGKTGFSIFEVGRFSRGRIKTRPISLVPMNLTCLHSVAYSPSGNYLALTNEQEFVQIFKKEPHSQNFAYDSTIYMDKQGNKEGIKGVDFSRSENFIGITMILPCITIFEMFSTD